MGWFPDEVRIIVEFHGHFSSCQGNTIIQGEAGTRAVAQNYFTASACIAFWQCAETESSSSIA